MRIQTTRESASTFISGIHFAAHPNPPQGGRLLVSEDVDPDANGVAGLLSLPGFEAAPAYADDVLDAVDAAIEREKNSAQTSAVAAVNQNVSELEAANRNLSAKVAEQREKIVELERQIGESAAAELRAEIERLQGRVQEAEAKAAGTEPSAREKDLETENATLRSRNETIGQENATLRADLEVVKAEKEKLAADLKAAQELLDADSGEGAATGKKGGKSK